MSVSLAAKATLCIVAQKGGKDVDARKRNGQVVARLPQVAELIQAGLLKRRRIFVELTDAGREFAKVNCSRSTIPTAPYAGEGSVDPDYELDAEGKIPYGPPLDLRRKT